MPLDYYSSGMITDEELHANLISQVPEGVRLISLMDCCNSGTGMDLPYSAEARGFNSGKGSLKSDRKKKGKKENSFKASRGTFICFHFFFCLSLLLVAFLLFVCFCVFCLVLFLLNICPF